MKITIICIALTGAVLASPQNINPLCIGCPQADRDDGDIGQGYTEGNDVEKAGEPEYINRKQLIWS